MVESSDEADVGTVWKETEVGGGVSVKEVEQRESVLLAESHPGLLLYSSLSPCFLCPPHLSHALLLSLCSASQQAQKLQVT